MNINKYHYLLPGSRHKIIAVCLAFSSSLASAASVVGIQIYGNRKIETAAITSRMKLKVGMEFTKKAVSDDIRAIYAMGYFDKVEAFEDSVPGGSTLQFILAEKPSVILIDFEGFDAVDKDEAKELITIKEFEVLDIHKLNQSVEKLIGKYEEKGHYLADVRYDLKVDSKKNEARITFRVEENEKVMVKKINIIGNRQVGADELMGVMQTQEGGPFSWMTGSGSYREAMFDRDIAAMTFYYGTLGFVRSRIGKPEVSVSSDKKWIYITFSVEEGEKYSVGKVDFSGELLFNRSELLSDMKLSTGDTFNTEVLRRETLRYTEKYSDLGFAFANVVPQPNIHDDTRTVDVTFDVDKGERVYIGRITVTGNTRTKDKVIRRELKIQEGELFNGTKKRESRENVTRLGFFESVEFHQSPSKIDPRVVDIEIKVKERSTGQLVLGAGYSAGGISGFMFQAQLAQNNFLGNGQSASFTANIQTGTASRYDFNFGFTEPYVGYSRWTLGSDLYQMRRDVLSQLPVPTFEEIRTGFDVKLGHPLFEFTNLFLTYRLENTYITNPIDSELFDRNKINGITSSVTSSIVYDKRDDRFDPRSGWFWSLSTEYAGLGGSRNYLKSSGNIKFFRPLFWELVFRSNLLAGNITQTGSNDVPVNEWYLMGGLSSLRGYRQMSIGESHRLPTNEEALSVEARKQKLGGQKIVVGGKNQVLLNAEIEFPIFKEARIRGVLFFDAGNAFNGIPGSDGRSVLFTNVGYGFRWFTPIGPLRFEFGYPIVNPGSPEFWFTIGPPF